MYNRKNKINNNEKEIEGLQLIVEQKIIEKLSKRMTERRRERKGCKGRNNKLFAYYNYISAVKI